MDSKFVEPTYRMKPHEELKFSAPAAMKVSEDVVKAIIADKKFVGDGDEAVWAVQITEQVKAQVIGEQLL
jgi:predicted aspartyl protease